MTGHTAGRWAVSYFEGVVRIVCFKDGERRDLARLDAETTDAEAAMLASAPALAAALRDLLDGPEPWYDREKAARAALAAAGGGR